MFWLAPFGTHVCKFLKIGVNLNQIVYLANICRDYEFKSELARMSQAYYEVKVLNFYNFRAGRNSTHSAL